MARGKKRRNRNNNRNRPPNTSPPQLDRDDDYPMQGSIPNNASQPQPPNNGNIRPSGPRGNNNDPRFSNPLGQIFGGSGGGHGGTRGGRNERFGGPGRGGRQNPRSTRHSPHRRRRRGSSSESSSIGQTPNFKTNAAEPVPDGEFHHPDRRHPCQNPFSHAASGGGDCQQPRSRKHQRFCTECSRVRQANIRFRDWLDDVLRRSQRRLARWSDDVGVEFGTVDEMDWQPEPVIRVLVVHNHNTTTTANDGCCNASSHDGPRGGCAADTGAGGGGGGGSTIPEWNGPGGGGSGPQRCHHHQQQQYNGNDQHQYSCTQPGPQYQQQQYHQQHYPSSYPSQHQYPQNPQNYESQPQPQLRQQYPQPGPQINTAVPRATPAGAANESGAPPVRHSPPRAASSAIPPSFHVPNISRSPVLGGDAGGASGTTGVWNHSINNRSSTNPSSATAPFTLENSWASAIGRCEPPAIPSMTGTTAIGGARSDSGIGIGLGGSGDQVPRRIWELSY